MTKTAQSAGGLVLAALLGSAAWGAGPETDKAAAENLWNLSLTQGRSQTATRLGAAPPPRAQIPDLTQIEAQPATAPKAEEPRPVIVLAPAHRALTKLPEDALKKLVGVAMRVYQQQGLKEYTEKDSDKVYSMQLNGKLREDGSLLLRSIVISSGFYTWGYAPLLGFSVSPDGGITLVVTTGDRPLQDPQVQEELRRILKFMIGYND